MNELFYRPVTIETKEQAGDYPLWTAAVEILHGNIISTAVKTEPDCWESALADSAVGYSDYAMIGWTVMVPVTLQEIFWEFDEEFGALPDIYGVD